MSIYELNFNYDYAVADVIESLKGVDSLELCAERPDLYDCFKYGWLTNESDIIPDFVIIMSRLIGCRTAISAAIKELIPNQELHPIKIGDKDYLLLSYIPILSARLNLKKSKIKKFSNGDIMEITAPVFLPDEYPILFGIEEMPSSYFCTQEFKQMVDSLNYRGLLFEECRIKSKSWF